MQRKGTSDTTDDPKYILARLKPSPEDSSAAFQRCDVHQIDNDNLLLVTFQSPNIKIIRLNLATRKFTEICTFNDQETFKTQAEFLVTCKGFVNSKLIYFFKNAPVTEEEHVFFFDSGMKKIFPIKNYDTRPSCFRINYTLSLYDVKIYLFGGMMMNLEPTNLLEAFDITTYTWEKVETKGNLPPPRHSHSAFFYKNLLYFMGGTASKDLMLDTQWSFNDLSCLNLDTYQWLSAKTGGSIPAGMPYLTTCHSQEDELMLFFLDRQSDSNLLGTAVFDLQTFEYKKAKFSQKPAEFFFMSTFHVDTTRKVVFQLGGISYTQPKDQITSVQRYAIFDSMAAFEKQERFGNEIVIDTSKSTTTTLNNTIPSTTDLEDEEDSEELTFEELLEREKKLQAEEMNKADIKKTKKKKNKKKGK